MALLPLQLAGSPPHGPWAELSSGLWLGPLDAPLSLVSPSIASWTSSLTLGLSTTLGIVLILVALALGVALTLLASNFLGKHALGQAQKEADQIRQRAETEGQNRAKQIELEARDDQSTRRETFDKEVTDTRAELKDTERRLNKREDNLDLKLNTLETKEKHLSDREEKLTGRESKIAGKQEEADQLAAERQKQLDDLNEQRKQRLLEVSNLSEEDARREALKQVEEQSEHEAGKLIARRMERAENDAKQKARDITLAAIQRYASEHTANSTVNTVQLASDDMKGRVIGREGRNIRAFQEATGVDLIVDDTPGIVVVSCFDPVRRATATEALQRLLDDGRVHPGRIEQVTGEVAGEMDERVKKLGNDAAIEMNLPGLSDKVNEMMGRLHYRTSFGQNILRHSVEVGYLCQVIAEELGLDGETARRCGYLHDIGKAMDHEVEGGHPAIGAEFARKHGETEPVLNAIAGHHNDIASVSAYTPVVMSADAISGARPGARRETMQRYVKRLEQLEEIANKKKGVKESYAIQAGREVRVVVDPNKVDDSNTHYLAREIAKQVSDEMTFPGEIKVTILREMRTVEYAK